MYNYYTYRKQQKEENQKDTNLLREHYRKISHRDLTDRLVKNYNNRINKFVLDMAKSPLVIKDYINPVESTRKQLMNESVTKMKGAKDFTFKPYICEKERIKQYLEERRKNREDFESISQLLPHKVEKFYNAGYEQPKMRFKPRTDLERIAESIHDFNIAKMNQQIIKRQLESKNRKFEVDTSSSETSFDEFVLKHGNNFEKKRLLLHSQGGALNSKQIDSLVAKQLMSEYHNKTHFKAAMSLAEQPLNSNRRNSKSNKPSGCESKEKTAMNSNSANISPRRAKKHGYLTSQYLHLKREIERENNNPSMLNQFARKFPLGEDNIDLVEANPLLYNLDFHLIKNASNLDLTRIKMDYLKQLAFENRDIIRLNKSRNNEKLQETTQAKAKEKSAPKLSISKKTNRRQIRYVDKTKIIIDNEEYPKDKIDVIAKKILRKCNYSHPKNPKNNKSLKKGEGKLMITSGMTLNDFNMKYLLKKR